MPSVPMNTLVGAAIIFLAGLLAYLFALGWIGKKPGVDLVHDRRFAGVRRSFRVAGPLLMILAVVLLVVDHPPASVPAPPEWQTVTTSDGVCSVEMPGKPIEAEGPALKELGKPESQQILVQNNGEVQYNMSHSDVVGAYRDLHPEKLLEVIGKNWLLAAKHLGEIQVIDERNLSDNGWPGKEIVLDIDSQRMQHKWFLVNHRLYRAIVSTPRDDGHLQDARRFLESFHVVKKPDADKGS